MRSDGRQNDELRPITITPGFIRSSRGSVLMETGNTRVICTATIEPAVPPFLRDQGRGWVTAEYSMLPASGNVRTPRESSRGKGGGRTHEIQRLIGRSLRSVVDMRALGERTVWLDCDVIEADGGTRTASITGAFCALKLALDDALGRGMIDQDPVKDHVAAVSVGIVEGRPVLDLCYEEDSAAEVDMNVVMTGSGRFIEIQGTGEEATFDRSEFDALLGLAEKGIEQLVGLQKKVLQ